jgi:DNA-binding transcriptional ArsR family regulator
MQSNSLTLDDVARLLGLVIAVSDEEGCSSSQAIERIAERFQQRPSTQIDRAALADFAARTRQVRMKRNTVIGAPIFRDPGFDMLLELFAADQRGQQISVTSICYASGVPMTTAYRHLDLLEKHGLVVREGDRRDHRRCYIRPTPKAIGSLEILFNQWLAAWMQLMDRTERGTNSPRPAQGNSDA